MDEMMEGGHILGWLWVLIPSLVWLALLVLLAWGVTRMISIRRGTGRGFSGPQWSQAEEILRERYARGEIDTEEYLERSSALSGERSNYGSEKPS